jgi:hypothetical protein
MAGTLPPCTAPGVAKRVADEPTRTNPVTNIAATVYCGGTAVGTTRTAPFSLAGDARIDDTLATPLPNPCLAPAVLLNPAAGAVVTTTAYIAATGA